MTKREIIENLYKTGKITFEEAITLASVPGEEPLVTFKDGGIVDPIAEQQNVKEKTINEFIKQIVDEYYDDNFPNENLAFDSTKCVRAMEENSWEWFDTGIPTEDEFKNRLRSEVKQVIEEVIRNYKKNKNPKEDYYYCTETGGIRVEGWITLDDEDGLRLEIRPMFILEESEFILDNDKVQQLIK